MSLLVPFSIANPLDLLSKEKRGALKIAKDSDALGKELIDELKKKQALRIVNTRMTPKPVRAAGTELGRHQKMFDDVLLRGLDNLKESVKSGVNTSLNFMLVLDNLYEMETPPIAPTEEMIDDVYAYLEKGAEYVPFDERAELIRNFACNLVLSDRQISKEQARCELSAMTIMAEGLSPERKLEFFNACDTNGHLSNVLWRNDPKDVSDFLFTVFDGIHHTVADFAIKNRGSKYRNIHNPFSSLHFNGEMRDAICGNEMAVKNTSLRDVLLDRMSKDATRQDAPSSKEELYM